MVFEDFETGFDKDIPKLITQVISIKNDSKTSVDKMTVSLQKAHCKLFEFQLEGANVTLESLFSRLELLASSKNIRRMMISMTESVFTLCTLENFKLVGNSELRELQIIIVKPPKTVTDESEKMALIKEFHDNPLFGGHTGHKKLYAKLRGRYYWKNMSKDIGKYVNGCENCKKNKHCQYTKEQMVITETPNKPFDSLIVDTIGPLPPSSEGYQYAVTMICDLTKFLVCAAVKDKSAKSVAEAIFKRFFLTFGPFRTLRSDRGTEYVNETITELCRLIKANHQISTAYHHQSLGTIERNHREFNKYFRLYLEKNLGDWVTYLDYFTFCYNIDKNGSYNYKYSPFELVFARSPNLPSDLLTGEVQPLYNIDNYVMEAKFRLQRAHLEAKKLINKLKESNKQYYDETAKPLEAKVGDTVYLRSEPYNKFKQMSKPYKIVREEHPNILISNDSGSLLVHKNRIFK